MLTVNMETNIKDSISLPKLDLRVLTERILGIFFRILCYGVSAIGKAMGFALVI